MITLAASHGLGISEEHLSLNQQKNALMFGWTSQYLALVAIGLAKLAIVAFLVQIHGYSTRYRTAFLWFLAGSNLIVNIIAMVLAVVQCLPVTRLWDKTLPGSCSGRERLQIFEFIQGCEYPTGNVDT